MLTVIFRFDFKVIKNIHGVVEGEVYTGLRSIRLTQTALSVSVASFVYFGKGELKKVNLTPFVCVLYESMMKEDTPLE